MDRIEDLEAQFVLERKHLEGVIAICKNAGISKLSLRHFAQIEFHESKTTTEINPAELAKALADNMPPDSAMMFAAVDDPAPEPLTPEVPSA